MKKAAFLALAGLALFWTSCGSEGNAGFTIDCADYTYIVNDCITNQVYTGSSIDVKICVDPEQVDRIKYVDVYYRFSSGDKSDIMRLEQGTHFSIVDNNTRIFIPWCFYFDNSSYVDHFYKIITTDEKETNEYKLHVNRPPGAN